MKIKLLNTLEGLKPLYDVDYDEKKKLHLGEVYEADIKQDRNLQFHRKYFKMISLAWEYMSEEVRRYFHNNREQFRKTLEVCAGWYDEFYSPNLNEWVQCPKSISFTNMEETEFNELYENVRDVLFKEGFMDDVTEDRFEQLLNF